MPAEGLQFLSQTVALRSEVLPSSSTSSSSSLPPSLPLPPYSRVLASRFASETPLHSFLMKCFYSRRRIFHPSSYRSPRYRNISLRVYSRALLLCFHCMHILLLNLPLHYPPLSTPFSHPPLYFSRLFPSVLLSSLSLILSPSPPPILSLSLHPLHPSLLSVFIMFALAFHPQRGSLARQPRWLPSPLVSPHSSAPYLCVSSPNEPLEVLSSTANLPAPYE